MEAFFRKYYFQENGQWNRNSFSYFQLKRQNINSETVIWHKGICPLDDKHEKPQFSEDDEGCSCTTTADKVWGLLNPLISLRNIALSVFGFTLIAFALIKIDFSPEINVNFNQYWGYQDVEGTVNGRTAKFRIAFLTNEFAWKFEDEVEAENGNVEDFLPKYLAELPGFHKSIGVIAVGTASEEGFEKDKEVQRAKKRMFEILKAVRITRGINDKELFTLNLGQHKVVYGRDNKDIQLTIDQRKIAVIGIMDKDNGMTIEEIDSALNMALSDQYSAIQIQNYSSFEFRRGT